jgi:hypothetical protein
MNNRKSQNIFSRLIILIVVTITLLIGLLMPSHVVEAGPGSGGGDGNPNSVPATPTSTH